MEKTTLTRRDVIRTAAATAFTAPMILGAEDKAGAKTFKVGLIGCGGRGRGAAMHSIEAGKILNYNVKVVAVADYFRERALKAGQQFGVSEDRCFGGAKCYEGLMETDAQIVLMATAPIFRPIHLEAAIRAGKHAFIEKPVAVDPPGCRRIIAAGEEAKKKGLVVIAGTEMRHVFSYRKTHQAVVAEKQLGKLYAGRVSFCIAHMFSRNPINPKTPEDLVRTWQNWTCLSGDHLVEQHVHNIDIGNWFAGGVPVSVVGFGGRGQRRAGDMYDFFSLHYDYGDGVHIHSMCRQVNGCWNWVGHDFAFEKGHTDGQNYQKCQQSPIPADLPEGPSESHQEQIDVLYQVNKGEPTDQAKAVAESTATAVMGRIAAYTGQQVFYDQIMRDPNKKPEWYNLTLRPSAEDFEKGTVEIPQENVVPKPGVG